MSSGFISRLESIVRANYRINPELYDKHGIRKGLRNPDGTGVKAVLTGVSDVIGYERDEQGRKIDAHGKLLYRGINIKDLVMGFQKEGRFGFEETAYLLMFGQLPTKKELEEFQKEIIANRRLPHSFVENIILPFPIPDIMNKLAINTLALYRLDRNADDTSLQNTIRQCISLLAKFPTIIAYSYRTKIFQEDQQASLHIHEPNHNPSTAVNFLSMIREDRQYSQLEVEVLDLLLVLHADHSGGNNSAFTLFSCASTGTDTYSCIAAAIGSLKGPLHGGANKRVVTMIDEMSQNVNLNSDKSIVDYLVKILRREAGDGTGKIYGLGHAVYTQSDPRAELLHEKAKELAMTSGHLEEFKLYEKVARLAPRVLSEFKGFDIKIAPNVDFYSGFVYKCMGFPLDIYPALFAMARIAGWSAHLIEQRANFSDNKLVRPASAYYGPTNVSYVPLDRR